MTATTSDGERRPVIRDMRAPFGRLGSGILDDLAPRCGVRLLEQDASRRLERAAERDQLARLSEIDPEVVRHQRRADEVEAEAPELPEPPGTHAMLLRGVAVGLRLVPFEFVHVG